MSKRLEYQRFVNLMINFTDRPVFLYDMFARGLTFEQACGELAGLKRNGARMFKAAAHGALDRPASKNRIVSLEAMKRIAARGALEKLRAAYGRRMTPEAKAWRLQQIEILERSLSRGQEAR